MWPPCKSSSSRSRMTAAHFSLTSGLKVVATMVPQPLLDGATMDGLVMYSLMRLLSSPSRRVELGVNMSNSAVNNDPNVITPVCMHCI